MRASIVTLSLVAAIHGIVFMPTPVHGYAEEVARAQRERRPLRLVNASQRAVITQAWVTSASRIDWGAPLLSRPLRAGDAARVFVTVSSADCVYHVRVQFEDGSTARRMRVHLCSNMTVTFR